METALALARRGLGRVWPNPSVGCVLVNNGHVVGRGWTGDGGRPHAETQALARAGGKAVGATAYVTLEPCAHEGETPACARILAEAGMKRVVFAVSDPDPRTAGKGAEILEKTSVKVEQGLCEAEARALNEGFFRRVLEGRPMVSLKVATSRDGKIAEKEGVRTRITGEGAQKYSHRLRATHDAILVGIGTVLADDPDLTCRLPGLEGASPVRVVLDTHLRMPKTCTLVKSADAVPVWVVTQNESVPEHLKASHFEIIKINNINNVNETLQALAARGITRLLVEGGSRVNTSFLESGLVDHLLWFRNDEMTLGEAAVPAFAGKKIASAKGLPGFQKTASRALDGDFVDFLERLD